MDTWLSLNEYANRHQVSISTLRRRIKSNKIKYKLDDGKYFLLEGEAPAPTQVNPTLPSQPVIKRDDPVSSSSHDADSMRLLLDELKRAYLDSLQSKEDQILYLKQQVSDLQTLVMLLEKENQRYKKTQGGP